MVLLLGVLILRHLLSILNFVSWPSDEIYFRLESISSRAILIDIVLDKDTARGLVLILDGHLLILTVRLAKSAL